jgi:hypothetical protein
MTHDLFSHLPPENEVDGNFATRMAHLWIIGDPDLDEQCRDCSREWMESERGASWTVDWTSLAAPDSALLSDELRSLVVASALAVERSGFFFELFTKDLGEVDWSAFATMYLDCVTGES